MSGPDTSTDAPPALALTRRSLLKKLALGAGAVSLSGGAWYILDPSSKGVLPGGIVGASASTGHLLREGVVGDPDIEASVETVIVGGGIAGLSAAWWLKKNGYSSFQLLELESEVGGNSRCGGNAISAYPWGAHYVPLPGPDAGLVRMLFEELGVIRGYDTAHAPIYDETFLCSDPHERLFFQGRWHEGLVPTAGISEEERRQYGDFFAAMERYKSLRGRDGKRAFSIPLDRSSTDAELTALDRISMEEYMQGQGWSAAPLHWYVDYCCRDDYGVGHDRVSAWAGIHYFASRDGTAANADPQTVLTWPEGNGWLAARLREGFADRVRPGSLVYSVEPGEQGPFVDYLDVTKRRTRVRCKRVIFAAPRFVASRVIRTALALAPDLHYAPWLVANVSMRSLPGGRGAPLAWDNVSYYSRSLGYIVATHQNVTLFPRESVLTYYRPLDEHDPVTARTEAIARTYGEWAEWIAEDLEKIHPGIRAQISQIDVWLWGHGMSSPGIGYLWGETRRKLRAPVGAVHFAHSDLSGISTFEEAQYQGVRAADEVLEILGLDRRKIA